MDRLLFYTCLQNPSENILGSITAVPRVDESHVHRVAVKCQCDMGCNNRCCSVTYITSTGSSGLEKDLSDCVSRESLYEDNLKVLQWVLTVSLMLAPFESTDFLTGLYQRRMSNSGCHCQRMWSGLRNVSHEYTWNDRVETGRGILSHSRRSNRSMYSTLSRPPLKK